MGYSQGSSRLQYWLDVREMKQTELSLRSGWSNEKGKRKKNCWSPRMISFFCTGTKPMTPEALYTFSNILNVPMDQLNNWPPD
jgi:hypothetical protein